MEWLGGFVLGFIADLVRSVFLPESTAWLNKYLPVARRKENLSENMLTLEVMERLKSLGKDPDLALFARDDAEQFSNLLTNQREAFVEAAIEVVDSTHMTQAEMNVEAGRRADVADLQLRQAMIAIEKSGWLEAGQLAALHFAQKNWEEYRLAQAQFAAAEFEGGTMKPLIYSSEYESLTVRRTGELKVIFQEMQSRYS